MGLSHAAAALMAIDHFNSRNPVVVPELAQYQDCPVQFDMEKSAIFDTGTYTHKAAETLVAQPELPCAVAGPFHDGPTLELSTLATALKFPVTAHRAFSIRALATYASPYTSQSFPDIITHASVLALYLIHLGRTDYVAFVYSLTETGLHRQETVTILLDEYGIENQAFAYNSPLRSPATSDQRTIEIALQGVIDSGYRTIVVAPDLPTSEIPLLAHVAEEMGLTNGDYLWIWFGDFDPTAGLNNTAVRNFLAGSVFMAPFEGYHLAAQNDPFFLAWQGQGTLEVERLNRANPIFPGEPGYFLAEDDYFRKSPEYGTAYLYDAIISTGIGACLAMASTQNDTQEVPVESFVKGIRSVDFTGATGVVRYCPPEFCGLGGGRLGETTIWGFLNNFPPGTDSIPWDVAEVFFDPNISTEVIFRNTSKLFGFLPRPNFTEPFDGFLTIQDYIFADGLNVPPDLLRDQPEQNYLSQSVRILGFVLVGVCMTTAVVSAIWVFLNRRHQVLKASQPIFLYLICFGSLVQVSAIITLSFDESYGWSEDQLSRACMATPWLACLGHIITYGALFSKLWRINRVLQFARRKVDIAHVAWPSAILVALALVVLGLWTGLDSMVWNRYELNLVTGESIGECSSENAAAYIIPLAVIVMIPTLLTFYMAWKTKDVDDSLSESRWIFVMILIQLEVLLFAAPLLPLLRDVSTDARYIGYSLVISVFPASTLLLIFGPKMYVFYRGEVIRGPIRGSRPAGQVRISGMSNGGTEERTRSSARTSHTDEGTQTDPDALLEAIPERTEPEPAMEGHSERVKDV